MLMDPPAVSSKPIPEPLRGPEHPLWERQVEMERGMLHEGADRVRNRVVRATRNKQMSRLAPVRSLLSEWLPPVSAELRTWVASYGKARGPKPIALEKLAQADHEVVSLVALRTVLDSITTERTAITGLAIEIGRTIEHEMQVRLWEETDPDLFRRIQTYLTRTDATSGHRRKVNVNRFNALIDSGELQIEWERWSQEMLMRVGIALLDCICKATGWFEVKPDPSHVFKKNAKRGPKLVFVTKPGLIEKLGKRLDEEELRSPAYKPTVIPPRPWESTRGGGYWTPYVRTPRLIRFKAHQEHQKEWAADEYEAIDMPLVYEAVNYLQDVPWRVNGRLLDVVLAAWERDMAVAGLPVIHEIETPPSPADAETNPDALRAWKRLRGETIRRNMKRLAEVEKVKRVLGIAFECRQFEDIYFPHMMDFRGRMYPIPTGLQPQGDDLARGLLEFAEGKPLTTGDEGNQGAGWLAIHLSACWGFDKASYEDRIAWVEAREETWRRIASDPLANLDWADTGVDKPWCSLAAVFEWVGWLDHGEGYVSHLPVSVDGTCNGIQHLSAMTRDAHAGAHVNLVPGQKPRDIYRHVAERVQARLERMAADQGAKAGLAASWLDLCGGTLPRSLTKRQVMVVPYGGTKDSFWEYTRAWLDEHDPLPKGFDRGSEAGRAVTAERTARLGFMVILLWDEVRDVVQGGVTVMEWLQKCAKATVEGNQPLFWRTPSGFVVRHFYGKQMERQVETLLDGQRVQLRVSQTTSDLDAQSQLRGIAPNFVHSLDAAALTLSLVAAKERGVAAITAVHDAYGTHAADMWPLYHILREAFVLVHSEDMLSEFRMRCSTVVTGHTLAAKPMLSFEEAAEHASSRLPALPGMGNLKLGDVLSSDYFFA